MIRTHDADSLGGTECIMLERNLFCRSALGTEVDRNVRRNVGVPKQSGGIGKLSTFSLFGPACFLDVSPQAETPGRNASRTSMFIGSVLASRGRRSIPPTPRLRNLLTNEAMAAVQLEVVQPRVFSPDTRTCESPFWTILPPPPRPSANRINARTGGSCPTFHLFKTSRNQVERVGTRTQEMWRDHVALTTDFPDASLPPGGDTSSVSPEAVRRKRLIYRSKQRGWLEVDRFDGVVPWRVNGRAPKVDATRFV